MIVLKGKEWKLQNAKLCVCYISEAKNSLFQIIYDTKNFNNSVLKNRMVKNDDFGS